MKSITPVVVTGEFDTVNIDGTDRPTEETEPKTPVEVQLVCPAPFVVSTCVFNPRFGGIEITYAPVLGGVIVTKLVPLVSDIDLNGGLLLLSIVFIYIKEHTLIIGKVTH